MADEQMPTDDQELRVTGESDPRLGPELFGALLRQARESRDETLKIVAARVGKSDGLLSRWERGQAPIDPLLVPGLLRAYGVTDRAVAERAEDLLRGSQDPWWAEYRTVIPKGLEMLLRVEADATRVYSVSTSFVEGLFQTREYAAAINTGTRLASSSNEASKRRVELRMARQRVLDRDVEFAILLDECVLRRMVGGLEVMHGQLKHLLALADRPRMSVQVLPFGAGAYPAMFANSMILESPGQQIVYGDTGLGNAYLSEPADVARVQQMFARALEQALSLGATKELLSELVRKYGVGDR